MIRLLTLLLLLVLPSQAADSWSVEYHRGLANKQRGDLHILLHGDRVFSHAFKEPAERHFENRIPKAATAEAIVEVSESPGTVWGSNPMHQAISEHSATFGLIWHRNWSSEYGRLFSRFRVEIRPGIHRITVPIDSWAWSNVYGKIGNSSTETQRRWRDSFTGPGRFGICAGGHFYAHGVEVISGVGIIKVLSLRILPN